MTARRRVVGDGAQIASRTPGPILSPFIVPDANYPKAFLSESHRASIVVSVLRMLSIEFDND